MPSLEVMETTMSGLASRAKFPNVSYSTLAISLVVSVVLFVCARAAFARLSAAYYIAASTHRTEEKDASDAHEVVPARRRWSWHWDGLHLSLPVSLTIREKDCPETGAGMGVAAALQTQQTQRPPNQIVWHARQSPRSPTFEAPLPALYDTPVPISAAKLIMARHTFRRPSPPKPKPTRSRSAPPPARPIPLPTPTMKL